MSSIFKLFKYSTLLLLVLNGCEKKDDTTLKSTLDSEIVLKYGESVYINDKGISVEFMELIDDSRCPTEVECFWEGQATIRLRLIKSNNEQTPSLTKRANHEALSKYEFETFLVELVDVSPYPSINTDVSINDYSIKINVTEL